MDGAVVGDAEDAEAERKKERVAREADEGGVQLSAVYGVSIRTIFKKIRGDAAVDERIAIDLGEICEHPEMEPETEGEDCAGDENVAAIAAEGREKRVGVRCGHPGYRLSLM